MGAKSSKQGNVMRIFQVKLPKRLRKRLKKKEKYVVIEQDEVDSAVPYLHCDNRQKMETQRGISVTTTVDGNLEVCIGGAQAQGYTDIPSDTSEYDAESSVISFEILGTATEQLSTPVSLEENPFDRRAIHTPDSALDVHYNTDTSVDDCNLCKAKNTEYMVYVFLPKLQRHLNVKEILPYLHFIDEFDARTLSNIEPQAKAVEKLIETIKNKVDNVYESKWLRFLVALEETDNIYLHQLLTGKTEKDHHFTSQILKIMKPSLINNIYLDDVVDLLFEKEIINAEDQSQITRVDKIDGPFQAVRVMLEKVDKRIPNWYTQFADVLHKAGMSEIAAIFKMIEHHEHVRPDDNEQFEEKSPIGKQLKRKFKKAKQGKCRLHNKMSSACGNTDTLAYEPESKKMRPDTNSYSDDGGKTNLAFSMTSICKPVELEVEELKKGMSEVQKVRSSVEIIENNQKEIIRKLDALMNIVNKHLDKSSDELMMLMKQIRDE